MGIFSKKELTIIEQAIEYVKGLNVTDYYDIVDYLSKVKNKSMVNPFSSDEFLCEIATIVVRYPSELEENINENFEELVFRFYQTYLELLPMGKETPDKEAIEQMFFTMIQPKGAICNDTFDIELYKLFASKDNYIFVTNQITQYDSLSENFEEIKKYIIENRKYFTNEGSFLADIISLFNSAITRYKFEKLEEELVKRTEKNKKQAGIYDSIDAMTLQRIDDQLTHANSILNRLNKAMLLADKKEIELTKLYENFAEELKEVAKKLISDISTAGMNAMSDFKTAYYEHLQQEKGIITNEADSLIRKMVVEYEQLIVKMEQVASSVSANTGIELKRLQNESTDLLFKLKSYIEDDNLLNMIANKLPSTDDFVERISKVTEYVESINKLEVMAKTNGTMQQKVIQVPGIILPSEPFDAPPINPYLDLKKGSFTSRFNRFWEELLKEAEKENVVLHKETNLIARLLLAGETPYLYGPSGCGKSFMAEFIIRTMGIDVIVEKDIEDIFSLKGYADGYGNYVPTNFFKSYTEGMAYFADELDTNDGKGALALRSFLGSKEYAFPVVGKQPRHPNNIIITAGNTSGSGANASFNGSNQMDERVQQRLKPILMQYDIEVEKRILKDYPEWLDFIILFRQATDEWLRQRSYSFEAPGVLTTDDAVDIAKYMKDEVLTTEEIIKVEFIENKSLEYLKDLSNNLATLYDNGHGDRKSKVYFKEFQRQVQEIKPGVYNR